MKKITYSIVLIQIFTFIFSSCSTIEDSESELITANNSLILNNCPNNLNSPSPFTSQISMFNNIDTCEGYAGNPGIGEQFNTCFGKDIYEKLYLEFNFSASPPDEGNSSIVFTFSSGAVFLDTFIGPNIELGSFIQPSEANIIYNDIACSIQEEFDALPPLNSYNQQYLFVNTGTSLDFLFSGTESQEVAIGYNYNIILKTF